MFGENSELKNSELRYILFDIINTSTYTLHFSDEHFAEFLKQVSSDLKFRKPSAPPIPESCCTKVQRGDKTETILDPNQALMEGCQKITFPDKFDETNLTCERSDHRSCLEYDTNMYCAPTGRCVCRLDMAFNKK